MSSGPKDLEHLISRFLDQELTAGEHSRLEETIRSDPEAARLFAQTAELDRRVGAALHAARERAVALLPESRRAARPSLRETGLLQRAGPQPETAPILPVGRRYSARVLLWWLTPGLAASLAGLFLLGSPQRGGPADHSAVNLNGVRAATLFAPPALGDAYVPDSAAAAAPQVRLEETERDWLVIPSLRAGEFLVVEVNRTQIKRVGIQQDF